MVNDIKPPKEPPFKTPETVASEEAGAEAKLGKKKMRHKFKEVGLKLWPSTKKQKIIGGIIAALILILGVIGVLALKNYLDRRDLQPVSMSPPKTTEPSKLTGVEIDPKLNKRRVIAIMLENSPDARPQAGLIDGGVVFEAIAEGGITRYCALYLEDMPKYIGPVRSVRPYYVSWLAGFDAAVAHAGGSGAGLAAVDRLKIKDLDYTKNNAYQRVSDRFAPHNLYTSIQALDKAIRDNKWKGSNFEGFNRKVELKNLGKTPVKRISFDISSGENYDTKYVYDKKTNSYKRYLAGRPHKDHKSGKVIQPKVVIAMITSYSQDGIYSVYRTLGKGPVLVFQDGKVERGIWKKAKSKKPLQFFDKSGKESLRLNPGQTWVTAVKGAGEVKYKH
jgi:hypothetical protein